MDVLCILLSAALLPVTAWGYRLSLNRWTMTVADGVSVGEGGTAVLPCGFTHPPPPNQSINGSVMWLTSVSGKDNMVFRCTYPGTDPSQDGPCESGKQRDAGSRFRFVGNLSNNDASIMMERLSRADSNVYHCRVELNIDKFQVPQGTDLTVNVAGGNESVVSGTEGASVTLPCTFIPRNSHTLTTVSWMRKETYERVVTFTPQPNGLWTTVNGENRYELIGNPKEGNASIRIKQLSVNDSHTYLCLVEYKEERYHYQYLIQTETQLQVKHGCSWLMGCTRSSERKDCGSASTGGIDPAHQQPAPEQGDSCTYAEIDRRTDDKRFTINASEDPQPDSCMYASVVIGSNRKDQGGKHLRTADSEETQPDSCTYASVVIGSNRKDQGGKHLRTADSEENVVYAAVAGRV
ncbi:uncharacterized protein LOC119970771 isoform X3 [Scyliorhinus canicula]|uniref:uncharacterized protein LOC119970771 isoform X3 n=1 Tax=Scyliorhinus canicula TaxID=7830 RepID=UPI0018F51CBB|nr:uncharacterized protein LOC119970771 isoform X3 [Scyliorhinus canicula]